MEKCPEISDSHSHQFGFKHNSSTLHAEFLLSEIIKYYNNNNSSIYIYSLDANKAFDSCNWELLFEKLYYNKKLSLSVVRALQSLYLLGTASISYLGHKSNHFLVSDCKVGTTISGVYTGIIAYADDIILLSPTLSCLQELVNKVQSQCQNLIIKLNTEKTEFIISGKSSITKSSIQTNGFFIHLKNKLKHLGFLWDNQNNTKDIATLQTLNVNERIIQFQSISRALIKSENLNITGLSTKVKKELYRSTKNHPLPNIWLPVKAVTDLMCFWDISLHTASQSILEMNLINKIALKH
ncbi:uncharacterized protein LOC136094520 [Hydra vulgaris]|uniref:uncharacterized protein LOC136094520 n=1 Tax=Hydra vulgaris TaxID=6087 RepID=UPI0032EA8B87